MMLNSKWRIKLRSDTFLNQDSDERIDPDHGEK